MGMVSKQSLAVAIETAQRWVTAYLSPEVALPHGQKVTLEHAQSTLRQVALQRATVANRPAEWGDVISINISGRIDQIEDWSTPAALRAWFEEVDPNTVESDVKAHAAMFEPLGLEGTFTVTGIEGKYCETGFGGEPWPLVLTPNMAPVDIMVVVVNSEANGYPNVNHVWFEGIDIDPHSKQIEFSMGS